MNGDDGSIPLAKRSEGSGIAGAEKNSLFRKAGKFELLPGVPRQSAAHLEGDGMQTEVVNDSTPWCDERDFPLPAIERSLPEPVIPLPNDFDGVSLHTGDRLSEKSTVDEEPIHCRDGLSGWNHVL
jgi:hypothetical protein